MASIIRNLIRKLGRSSTSRRRRVLQTSTTAAAVDGLEEHRVLSATVSNGVLTINGGTRFQGGESCQVDSVGSEIRVSLYSTQRTAGHAARARSNDLSLTCNEPSSTWQNGRCRTISPAVQRGDATRRVQAGRGVHSFPEGSRRDVCRTVTQAVRRSTNKNTS